MEEYSNPIEFMIFKNDLDVAFTDMGEGEKTLVFVHGLASNLPVWKKNIEFLKEHYRCVALDLPGHGLSTKGDFPYNISFYMETLMEWLKRLRIENPILIGHSMGGQVAIKAVLENPDFFKKMILVAAAGLETFTIPERMMMKQFASLNIMGSSQYLKLISNVKNYFYDAGQDDLDDLIRFNSDFYTTNYQLKARRVLSRSIAGMMDEPVFAQLKNLNLPTFIAYGKSDQFIPNRILHALETTEQLARRGQGMIPDSELKIYEKSGHFLQYERAQDFNTDIQSFIEQTF